VRRHALSIILIAETAAARTVAPDSRSALVKRLPAFGDCTMRPRIDLLQGMPIFGGIREESLSVLLRHAREVTVQTGAYFFHEDDKADSMFVLESGRAWVIKSWQRREVVLHQLEAGDCFGEMALMDLFPRSASVRADDECHSIEIGTGDLLQLFEHDVEQFALLQMNIGREVCRRLRATDELLFREKMGEKRLEPTALFRAA
jgi:CRP-like cAMP-binding protein